MSMEYRWNDPDGGNPKYGDENCPNATSSTTNPTWDDLRLNPGFRFERTKTNRLIHFMARPTDVLLYSLNDCGKHMYQLSDIK